MKEREMKIFHLPTNSIIRMIIRISTLISFSFSQQQQTNDFFQKENNLFSFIQRSSER